LSQTPSPALGLPRGTTVIREYDVRWIQEFDTEAETLRSILGASVSEIEHVGSTAVPGLAAKPILDLALAFDSAENLTQARRLLRAKGYSDRGDQGEEGGVVFVKGPASARTHHLHLVQAGSNQWCRYLTFRDTLRIDQVRREEYATLKKEVASQYRRDRPAYQQAKSAFIQETLARAMAP
jgi:GrpB-like predicted nucleotidyltransferase (UPF0157 family)